jgi:hypothetical protein
MIYPRWRWLLPAALAVAALIASATLMAPLLATQLQQALFPQLSRMGTGTGPFANLRAQIETLQSPPIIAAMTAVAGIFRLVLGWLLQAAIVYFGILIGGTEMDFRRVLAAVPWLSIPFVLETIERTVYVLSRGQLIVNQGLSYLASSGKVIQDSHNLAYIALSQVSLFQLWHWLLVYALFHVAGKLERGTAFIMTIIYAGLLTGGQLVLATLGGRTMPGI